MNPELGGRTYSKDAPEKGNLFCPERGRRRAVGGRRWSNNKQLAHKSFRKHAANKENHGEQAQKKGRRKRNRRKTNDMKRTVAKVRKEEMKIAINS